LSAKKVAITGHTKGIGKALYDMYTQNGWVVVGLSRSNGYNIKLHKINEAISDCDVLVNNAWDEFGQVELLIKTFYKWIDCPDKTIINISTALQMYPISVNQTEDDLLYHVTKRSLEEAITQLRSLSRGPRLITVRPGAVATQMGEAGANPNVWADSLMKILYNTDGSLQVSEITMDTVDATIDTYKD
jgi:NAD(P)-dependent dehydrogenase (short-subunit alcohol dehydrogenase family)